MSYSPLYKNLFAKKIATAKLNEPLAEPFTIEETEPAKPTDAINASYSDLSNCMSDDLMAYLSSLKR